MFARARGESAEVFEKTKKGLAGTTGLEPATSDVTGRRSKPTELRPRWVALKRRTSVRITHAVAWGLAARLTEMAVSQATATGDRPRETA